jgi:hypothetical protein
MRLQGNLRCILVSDMRIQRRHQHERIFQIFPDSRLIWLNALRAVFVERMARVPQEFCRREYVVQHHGLEYVQLEIPLRAGKCDGEIVSIYLRSHHRHRLALRRIDFARHDG